jgi:YbbR domain-containing protein
MKSSFFQKWMSPSRVFQRLRHLHIENKGLKLSAFVLALLLFVVSRQPITNVRLSGVPVEIPGLTSGVEISGDVQQTVSVILRGPRDIVRSLTPNQISVTLNLSNREPGERFVQLRPEDVFRPDNIEVLQIEPASIKLRIEPTERKLVNVEHQFIGQVAEGLEVYDVRCEPSIIEIEGPYSQVNKVSFVLTEPVNLSGRTSDFRIPVDVDTSHNSLRVKTPVPIILSVEIGERRKTRIMTKVPVIIPHQQPGVRLLPKVVDVELYGPQSALDKLQPDDLRVEPKTDGLPPSAETVTLQIKLPATTDKHIAVKNIIPSEVRLKRQ